MNNKILHGLLLLNLISNDTAVKMWVFNTELNASNLNLTKPTNNRIQKYVDESHLTPSGQQKDTFRYLMDDVDESSSENNISVSGIVSWDSSHTK